MNYNSSTECVTFANTGTPCSPLATETRQWRNLTSNPWANIPVSNQICDCDIRERGEHNSDSFRSFRCFQTSNKRASK
jgi:hypothetical protein